MTNKENPQGILINAVHHGGVEAIWQIARGRTPLSEAAREALELATSPYHDLSLEEAIILATKSRSKK
jgi:hypothetical protein